MADPFKFTTIAFGGRDILGPYSKETIQGLAGDIEGEVLEIGCGKGAILEAFNLKGTGIDLNPNAIEEAVKRNPGCRFFAKDAKEVLADLDLHPDLIICLGASQAIGSPDEALTRFSQLLSTGGHLLFGDGFWQSEPSPEYLEFLGASREDMTSFELFRDAGLAHGLVPIRSYISTQEDWDAFEDTYYDSMIEWCDQHPDDPDAPAFRERMTNWRKGYEAMGRGTLGFAIILYRKD